MADRTPWPGPNPGESWPDWLRRQVREASPFDVPGAFAIVVLQPGAALAIADALDALTDHDHSEAWGEEPITIPVAGCTCCEALAALALAAVKSAESQPGS